MATCPKLTLFRYFFARNTFLLLLSLVFATLSASAASNPVLVASGWSLTAESCPNSAIDPDELVTVQFAISNTVAVATANLTATLQASANVLSPSQPQSYGALLAGNPAETRSFSFRTAGACGEVITATLTLQDGATDLGSITFSLRLGSPVITFTENFDGVSRPALPAGWTTSVGGTWFLPWITDSSRTDTAPNSAFTYDPDVTSDISLVSPAIHIQSAGAQLSFRQNFGIEPLWDGGVLEIAISGGPFVDILAAGGSFVTNGYNTTIIPSTGPLPNRRAWSGNSGGFITTMALLPDSAAGHDVQLRWRLGANADTAGPLGWYIDTISIVDAYSCCMADQTTSEDTPSIAIPFSVGEAGNQAGLSLLATSANQALVPNGNLVFGGSGSDRTVTITPAANQNGTAPITLTVRSDSGTSIRTFNFTVTPVNDPPSFTKGPNITVAQNAGAQSLPAWASTISAGPSDETGQTINFVVSSARPDLFAVQPAISPSGTLSFSPSGQNRGTAVMSVQLHDNGGTVSGGNDLSSVQTFTITIGLPADNDGDGLPDDFELAFGLNPADPSDVFGDVDGDGFSTIQEFWAGTNPRDAQSRIGITSIQPQSPSVAVQFPSVQSVLYSIQFADAFPNGSWQTLADNLVGTGGALQTSDPSSAGLTKRVYRVNAAGPGGTTVTSDPSAFCRIPLLGNSDTLVSIPVLRPAATFGVVQSFLGNAVQIQGSPAWQPNQWIYNAPAQTNTYFALFLTGSHEGEFFTVTANSSDTLTLDLLGASLSGVTTGDRIALVPYWTLGTLFPSGRSIAASPTPGNRSTEILLPDVGATGVNVPTAKTYYFWNGAWRQVGTGLVVKNDEVFLPDMFFWVRNNLPGSDELVANGTVLSTKWRFLVRRNSNGQQDNLVALPRINTVALNASGLFESGAVRASSSPGNRLDELMVFDNSVAAKNKSAAATYYYWNNAWRKVGAGAADVGTDLVFTPGTGVVLRSGSGASTTVWTNSLNVVQAPPAPVDSDGDGVLDADEVAAGTDPFNELSLTWKVLATWRFNDASLNGDAGQAPIAQSNVSVVDGFEGKGAQLSGTASPTLLQYRAVESSGLANISLRRGSIHFRYKPTWFSNDPAVDFSSSTFGGFGPGSWITLLQTTNFTLRIDPNGTNLVLTSAAASGNTVTNLQVPILVRSQNQRTSKNQPGDPFWYECLLTYSPEKTTVFWNLPEIAQLVNARNATGPGIVPVSPLTARNSVLAFGSATDGTGAAKGVLDEIVSFNAMVTITNTPWQISAISSNSPVGINLVWSSLTNGILDIKRRVVGTKTWGAVQVGVGTNYFDSTVVPGEHYEYNLNSRISTSYGFTEATGEFVTASVSGAPIEQRGKLILLVDKTLTNAIENDLSTYVTNLIGDGWEVLRANVPRHIDDNSSSNSFLPNYFNITNEIVPFIRTNYALYSTNIKHILIIGHVTIPYSGTFADDGHYPPGGAYGAHNGAWPCDAYYGDIDGIWTDSDKALGSAYVFNWNYPNDGRFDQDYVPENASGVADVEIPVARIDLARLVSFSESEEILLKKYLQKNITYRNGLRSFAAEAIAADYFPFPPLIPEQTATELISKLAILKSPRSGDPFIDTNSFVIGVDGGPGYFDRINDSFANQHTTANFAQGAVSTNCAFYFLRGSYFPDWNCFDNVLRATLCTTNGGLAAGALFAAKNWRSDALGNGFCLGDNVRDVLNDRVAAGLAGQTMRSLEIMGDSTLRYPVLLPPASLTSSVADGSLQLQWVATTGPETRYYVYRSPSGINGPFTKLTSAPLTATTFVDSAPPAGGALYMVRSLQLVTTGSGSFTNISQGVFVAK